MIDQNFKNFFNESLTSFEAQTVFFYTVVDTLYIGLSIVLFLIFRCFFYREHLVVLLILKKNRWYQNILFLPFLLAVCIPNRVYVYNKSSDTLTFLIYGTLIILGFLENAVFLFFVLAYFFLCVESTLIGYSLGTKNVKINSFYSKYLFNNQNTLQKKFVELFFGNPHGTGFRSGVRIFTMGTTLATLIHSSSMNRREIAEKQTAEFVLHSKIIGEGKMTPEQTLALRRAINKDVFEENASFVNRTLAWSVDSYKNFSKPISIKEVEEENTGYRAATAEEAVGCSKKKLTSFDVDVNDIDGM